MIVNRGVVLNKHSESCGTFGRLEFGFGLSPGLGNANVEFDMIGEPAMPMRRNVTKGGSRGAFANVEATLQRSVSTAGVHG